MACYTVHVPEGPGALERSVFVRDGFSFWAFAYGPFWLLRHGAWIAALLTGVALAGLIGGLAMLGASSNVMMLSYVLAMVLIGFEASTLRRWGLALRGFSEAGLVAGDDLHTLERRFFEATGGAGATMAQPTAPPAMPTAAASYIAGPAVLGLFPGPGTTRAGR